MRAQPQTDSPPTRDTLNSRGTDYRPLRETPRRALAVELDAPPLPAAEATVRWRRHQVSQRAGSGRAGLGSASLHVSCGPPRVCPSVHPPVRRLWVLSALQTLFLLPLGFLVLPLLYLAVVNPDALCRGLWRLRSGSAFRRLRYTLSPLLELRVRGLLPV